jgi:hypothetical protein
MEKRGKTINRRSYQGKIKKEKGKKWMMIFIAI